jgi:UDP-glucose:(heptosyl)LPS alpha-1,3-glucosyltransferase
LQKNSLDYFQKQNSIAPLALITYPVLIFILLRTRAQQKHPVLYKLLPRYRIFAKLEEAIFSKTANTKILLLNPLHQQDFITHYQTPKKNFILLAPGINQDRQRPLDQLTLRQVLRKKYNIHDDEKIILMVGSGFKVKGVDRALLAFKNLSSYFKAKTHLWIVGKGEPSPQEHVTFWGPRNDIINFYAAADFLLHPSYQETAGMVLLESLVAGLPVVVTQNCGYAIYIQKAHAGIVISEPFEQEKLNQALINILSDDNTLSDYRQNALNFCKSHNLFRLAEQVTDIIEGKK